MTSLRLLLLQKSGINAKNDNVKVLGIRVREVMHERRIELLERSAVLPGGPLLPRRPPCPEERLHTGSSHPVLMLPSWDRTKPWQHLQLSVAMTRLCCKARLPNTGPGPEPCHGRFRALLCASLLSRLHGDSGCQ